jgi:secreted trypsin-like serine protease
MALCTDNQKLIILGDSGGGFIFEHRKKFYLRGIFSAAVSDEEYACSLSDFAVFTDVAQYTSWIYNFIDTYG